jgi:hypothetical protein
MQGATEKVLRKSRQSASFMAEYDPQILAQAL